MAEMKSVKMNGGDERVGGIGKWHVFVGGTPS